MRWTHGKVQPPGTMVLLAACISFIWNAVQPMEEAAAADDDDVMIDITSGDDEDVPERELIQTANKKPRTSAASKK